MIVCPNCQTENRLGAIFCRSCGAKLALDDLNVQNFEEKTGVVAKDKIDKAKKKRRVIVNLIRIVFLLLIAYGIFLVFQRPEIPEFNTLGKANELFIKKEKALIEAKKAGRDIEFDFTELEINSFASTLREKQEANSRVKIEEIFVDLMEDNKIQLFINTLIFGRKITLSCSGKLSAGDNGLIFEPSGFFAARMGKLPYPMPLFRYMTKNVLAKHETMSDLFSAISNIEITEGKSEYKAMPGETLTPDSKKQKEKEAEKGRARVKFKKV